MPSGEGTTSSALVQPPQPARSGQSLGREARITVLSLLKCFYDEDIFRRLVREIYNADPAVSEAAIRASASLGNEVATKHLYEIIGKGTRSQRLAAIQALAAVRAPSSTGMLIKYFNHFSEEDLRTEILRAINLISATSPQVQELDQAVALDPRQSEEARRIATEALVDGEKGELLGELLPKAPPSVQTAAFARMMQTGSHEVPDFTKVKLDPASLGAYLCLCVAKARAPQQNWILENLQRGQPQTLRGFLAGLTGFKGRLRFPTRVFRLLLVLPYIDAETEGLLGDLLRRIVGEVRGGSPHLLSEFSVITSAHLDTVFAKVRKSYVSLKGITRKDELLAAVLALIVERYASPDLLADLQAFFRDESTGRTPPVGRLRALMVAAPKEDRNRLDACLPLFTLVERKDRLAVAAALTRVDLARPVYLRRLNRLIRLAGVLEIRTASKKIQEILDWGRSERVPFIEESSIVTLCQLLTRSIIEQSRDCFREPARHQRSLLGYVRGARWMPPRIMIGPLVHLVLQGPDSGPARALAVESLEAMDLTEVAKNLPPLLKSLDQDTVPVDLRMRIATLLGRFGDATFVHQALDLTGAPSPATRRAALRVLRGIGIRGAAGPADVLVNRLYLLLEDADREVRLEALATLLALNDDYAAEVVGGYVAASDASFVADLLRGLSRPLSREAFGVVRIVLTLEDAAVQERLREMGPDLCQSAFAEETRQALLEALSGTGAAPAARPAARATAGRLSPADEAGIFSRAKDEIKFKGKNTQVLTVMFADIADSTEKSTRLSPKDYQEMLQAFEENVERVVDANRGHIVKKMGDGILATFHRPVHAVVAAMKIQDEITQVNSSRLGDEKFEVRIGLNTGSVIRKDGDVFGEVVNVASRMQSAAPPGDVFLTPATFKEVQSYVRCIEFGGIMAKGIKEAITAYSPEEVLVDLASLRQAGSAEEGSGRGEALERLREEMFVPEFRVPEGARQGTSQLREVFVEIAKAVEEIAQEPQQEYDFKRWLQKRWDEVARQL